jgi:ABC-2 type transport system ATP-binding protein
VRIDDATRVRDAVRLLGQALGDGVHEGGEAGTLTARIEGENRIAEALAALASAGIGVAELTLGQPSLDDVFFALTGKPREAVEGGTLPTTDETRKEARA